MKKKIIEGLNIPKVKYQYKYFKNGKEVNVDDIKPGESWYKQQYDSNGNVVYYETSDGGWGRNTYDFRGNIIYYEDSTGYWEKHEYDTKGDETYYENSMDFLDGNDPINEGLNIPKKSKFPEPIVLETKGYCDHGDEYIGVIEKSNYNGQPVLNIYRIIDQKTLEKYSKEQINGLFKVVGGHTVSLTPGQWYVSTLFGEDGFPNRKYTSDKISLNGDWVMSNFNNIMKEIETLREFGRIPQNNINEGLNIRKSEPVRFEFLVKKYDAHPSQMSTSGREWDFPIEAKDDLIMNGFDWYNIERVTNKEHPEYGKQFISLRMYHGPGSGIEHLKEGLCVPKKRKIVMGDTIKIGSENDGLEYIVYWINPDGSLNIFEKNNKKNIIWNVDPDNAVFVRHSKYIEESFKEFDVICEGLNIPKKKYQDKYFQDGKEVDFNDINPDNYWYKNSYDQNGNNVGTINSDGISSKLEYNNNNRLINIKSSDGTWAKFEYDANGNQIYYEDSNGNINDNRPITEGLNIPKIPIRTILIPGDFEFIFDMTPNPSENFTCDNDEEFYLFATDELNHVRRVLKEEYSIKCKLIHISEYSLCDGYNAYITGSVLFEFEQQISDHLNNVEVFNIVYKTLKPIFNHLSFDVRLDSDKLLWF